MTTKHTPAPWMTMPCGTLSPDDVMIVADLGVIDCLQHISTVAKTVSVRQTAEVSKANAEFIVHVVNVHDDLLNTLRRISALTPEAANAASARDLHLTISAIADSALARAQGRS